jgi:NADH:ubiquinone oxidoreductase subunit 3 (subunit A)
MGDIIVIFFFKNVLVFSIIFWALLFICGMFYKIKNQQSKKHFCECGFKSLSDVNIQINVNFLMVCIFLILYDIEFILMFPFLFNIYCAFFYQYLVFFIFLLFILVSLLYDWQMNALD